MKPRIGNIYEMGIDLTRHGKESYLGKAHHTSAKMKTAKEATKDIVEAIKNMPWQNLGIAPVSGSYYIVLPQNIQQMIREYRAAYPEEANQMGRWYGLDGEDGVYMRVDSDTNRSHFPGGIPELLKGTGLGYKCYRALLEHKKWLTSNTSGSQIKNHAWASMIKKRPDPDDVHAIVGPSNVLAMIKNMPDARKIEIAKRFIDNTIAPNINGINDNNFAMDDELRAIMPPDVMATFDPTQREAVQRRQREEAEAETRRRTEAEAEQSRALYPRFGVSNIDRNFRPGDIVVRYTMLNSNQVKPRIIARVGDTLKAVSIRNFMDMSQNINYRPTEVRDLNDSWTKINAAGIPDLNNVNLDDTEQAYLRNLISSGQTSAPAPHTEQARDLAVRTLRRDQPQGQDFNSGPRITIYDTETYYDLANARLPQLTEHARVKLKQEDFVKEIYMTNDQYARYRDNKSSEVFAGFNGTLHNMTLSHGTPQKAVNTLTGFVVEHPNNKPFAGKFSMVKLRNKRDVRPGEMIYIATHPTYFGLTGRVSYSAAAQQREFVYVEIFNPQIQGQKGRKVPIDPRFLRKLRMMA